MVTKLKNNEEYITYIQNQMTLFFPENELVFCAYHNQINNNFQIGYVLGGISIIFTKDRGLMELDITKNGRYPKNYRWEDLYNKGEILKFIPGQSTKFLTICCVEIIDYYFYYLKENIDKFEFEE